MFVQEKKMCESSILLQLDKVKSSIKIYSQAIACSCMLVDTCGKTLAVILPFGASLDNESSINFFASECFNAELIKTFKEIRHNTSDAQNRDIVIFSDKRNFTYWTTPIIVEECVFANLICGPTILTGYETSKDCLPSTKNILQLLNLSNVDMNLIPEVTQERIESLGKLLHLVVNKMADVESIVIENRINSSENNSGKFVEQLSHIKASPLNCSVIHSYPFDKEDKLLETVKLGNRDEAENMLNEILDEVITDTPMNIQLVQMRLLELVVLLSRATIRAGADTDVIFDLNRFYLDKLVILRNVSEMKPFITRILSRFMNLAFQNVQEKKSEEIIKAKFYIMNNFMKKISLEETAAFAYISPSYLCRMFKEETGENFTSYLNRVRIGAAKQYLLGDLVSLSEISDMTGFQDQSYFSKVFKKITGTTPWEFRKQRGLSMEIRELSKAMSTF